MSREFIRVAVTESLARLTGRPSDCISDDDDLAEDLGVDSLVAVKLIETLEGKLGLPLPEGSEALLVTAQTVEQLVDRLHVAIGDEVALVSPT